MTIKKAGTLLILCGLTAEIAAFTIREYIPYALIAGVTAVNGYKLYENKGYNRKRITLQEGLPYATGAAAALYGCYSVYAQKVATEKLETKIEEARKAMTQVSWAHLQSSIEGMEKKYSLTFNDLQDEASLLYNELCTFLKSGSSVNGLEPSLERDMKELQTCKSTLEVGISGINSHHEKDQHLFDTLGKKLLLKTTTVLRHTEKLLRAFREHKHYFMLEHDLLKNGQYEYQEEKRIMSIRSNSIECAQ
ncbi:hypothetical protein H0X06_06805, partial [Candidatus Dependentiae bacterium]|nr:hypothetical protein [Candidatus Dependentiae bacterium]